MPFPPKHYFGNTSIAWRSKQIVFSDGEKRYVYSFGMNSDTNVVQEESVISLFKDFLSTNGNFYPGEFGFSCKEAGSRGKHQRDGIIYFKEGDTFIPFKEFTLSDGHNIRLSDYHPNTQNLPSQVPQTQEAVDPVSSGGEMNEENTMEEHEDEKTVVNDKDVGLESAASTSYSHANGGPVSLFFTDSIDLHPSGASNWSFVHIQERNTSELSETKQKPRPKIPDPSDNGDGLPLSNSSYTSNDQNPSEVYKNFGTPRDYSKDGNVFFVATPINYGKLSPMM